ncbi:hypothetical protein ABID41_002168 [Phenylobacterium koreense]|uniref:Uncharacterized protein n=1 Tax=Phenylobacterium koreense TaxID=266125 RepID=A0ABV2EJ46_9CAUL
MRVAMANMGGLSEVVSGLVKQDRRQERSC